VPVESTHPSCTAAAHCIGDASVLAAHGAPGTSAPSAVGSLTQRQAGPGLRANPLAGPPLCPCTGLWQSPAFARLDLPDSQGCQSAPSANHLHRGVVRESERPHRALFLVSRAPSARDVAAESRLRGSPAASGGPVLLSHNTLYCSVQHIYRAILVPGGIFRVGYPPRVDERTNCDIVCFNDSSSPPGRSDLLSGSP